MLPIILGLVGGYLIVDSQKEKLKFEDGGTMAKGGEIDRYNLSFNYNPDIVKTQDIKKIRKDK